ncbi:MAG: Fe-S cluster assembly protein SufD [Gammaproteobacteria bacterium]|nr:Fe-S cluster assembly protein SufD [Gammaproteobacteria bacterium]
MSAVDHYLNAFETEAAALPGRGQPWLDGIRDAGIERFAEVGFPTPRNEQWKYTRVAAIEKRRFGIPAAGAPVTAEQLEPFLFEGLECDRLVFVNGRYAGALSSINECGVRMESLAAVLKNEPALVERHLAHYGDMKRNAFTALNAAFMLDGAYIHLPRDVEAGRPVHLLFVSTEDGGEFAAHTRNLIVAEEGSSGRIIESYVALGDGGYLTNNATELVLGANSELEHYKLQEESLKAFHVAALDVHQDRDSRFTSHAVSFGALLGRQDINAVLDAEGAVCNLYGLYVADGKQHVDFHTTVEHAKPHGTSREFYKGIIGGRARGVFNGRVHVHQDAQKTDSQQSNKNLLLSHNAEVDAKPELEIYADDVKCSHGATVGQLDDDMLFYLRSRGIDKEAARGLLTYGFAQDIIGHMSLAPVRDYLERVLVRRVPAAESLAEIL